MEKTPAVAYISYKIKNTDRVQLLEELKHAPLKKVDYDIMLDIINGMTYKELSCKYDKSEAGIASWKRRLFEQLHRYEMKNLGR